MKDLHGAFIAAAYGLTAVALILEWVVLSARRRAARERVARERTADDATLPNP